MQLTGEAVLAADREAVWAALNDPAILQACIPGCETFVRDETAAQVADQAAGPAPDQAAGPAAAQVAYDVTLMAAVGPVKARFKGRLELQDAEPPERYRLAFQGQGGMAGFARGGADVTLEALAPGEGAASTRLAYAADAEVGGKIAQIGSRLIDMAARKMAAQFFANFEAALADRSSRA